MCDRLPELSKGKLPEKDQILFCVTMSMVPQLQQKICQNEHGKVMERTKNAGEKTGML